MSIDNRFELLPSELRRRNQLLESEKKVGVAWLDSCPPEVGRKIESAIGMLTNRPEGVYSEADRRRGHATHWGFIENKSREALNGAGDDEDRLDVVAATLYSFLWLAEHDNEEEDSGFSHVSNYLPEYDTEKLIEVVNDILLHARVDWVFEDGRFQERGNSTLHSEVVRPITVSSMPIRSLASHQARSKAHSLISPRTSQRWRSLMERRQFRSFFVRSVSRATVFPTNSTTLRRRAPSRRTIDR